MLFKRVACAMLFALIGISGLSFADDTELYVFESSNRTGDRPKVLIIFDNSGSMATIEEDAISGYDPEYVQEDGTEGYPPVGSSHSYQGRMLYFTKGGIDETSVPIPDSPSESRRFLDIINSCNQSRDALNKYGRFTGYLKEYLVKGKTGTWSEVRDNNGANIDNIDCWEDVQAEDPVNSNSIANGFPVNALKVANKAYPYNHVANSSDEGWSDALSDAAKTNLGTGAPITLYTDDYLRWYRLAELGMLPSTPQSRLDIAKDAMKNIVITTPSVDFGLAVFNLNYPNDGNADGGRIVSGIKTRTAAEKDALLSTIDNLPADTNTPLCETMFEAYRYYSGGAIKYGHADTNYHFGRGNNYTKNIPPYDTSVESGSNYISPLKVCPDKAYVVYITDGSPTVDQHADGDIISLTATASAEGDYSAFSEGLRNPSYLAALASYMHHNDVAHKLDENGDDLFQNVVTYTIGFSAGAVDAAPLLKETARRGGGEYFAASNSLELQAALTEALSSIMAVDSTFTSPSVANNNYDRTQTLDVAYYGMFIAGEGPRWTGNLKKLRVVGGAITDANGKLATGDNGNILPTACTYWSDCSIGKDGNKVTEGGAAASLQKQAVRKLLSNTGSGGSLEALTVTNISGGDRASLATYMKTTEAELENTLSWLVGVDVDDDNNDGSKLDIRSDIMGDPLHSKPLAIDFGSEGSPDIRIVFGTNQGLIHMLKDLGSSVTESWGFIPYELLPNVTKLRENVASGGHTIYGMDLSPVAYIKMGASGVEKAWVFSGMRRGGSSYYALDISSPDSPSLMWTITPDSAGFGDLGQTWSEPVLTKIPGHSEPVIIFGGGYDISYDATPTTSPVGRSVYIVDAKSGTLLHTFGASASGGTQIPGITDSIATPVAVLDSNNDGITDRIYATDVGGNIWRMDLPSETRADWTAFKFADVGGSTLNTDRRFFSEAVVAQTVITNIAEVTVTETDADGQETTTTTKTYQNVPYDAVTVGTGNRPTPSNTDVVDMYYVFQDRNVNSRSFNGSSNAIPETLTINDLYNVSTKAPETEAENITFGKSRGWYYDFSATGEKSLSASLIIEGKVYFTTFVPSGAALSELVCTIAGHGRLYIFDLHKGTRTSEYIIIERESPPDTPPFICIGGDCNIIFPCSGEGCDVPDVPCTGENCEEDPNANKGIMDTGLTLDVNKIYYHTQD